MNTVLLNKHQIPEAVRLLKQGEVLAIPTETVYGLAADATNDEAVRKIFAAKNRPIDHPLIVHVDSYDKAVTLTNNLSAYAEKLAKAFWPGPLTLICEKHASVSKLVTGGLDTVGLRVPNHPMMLAILKAIDSGLAAPSANLYQQTSPTKAIHVLESLGGRIPAILDGGECSVGLESTILDLTAPVPVILRPGAITAQMIEACLGLSIKQPRIHNIRVSGNLKVHYQPKTPLHIVSKAQLENHPIPSDTTMVMHYSTIHKHDHYRYIQMPAEKAEYTKRLYAVLHEVDNSSASLLLVERPPEVDDWADVHDRLSKAASET